MAPPLRDAWPWQRHLAFLGLRVLLGEVAPAPPPPPSAPPRERETGCFPEGLSPPRRFVPSPRALRGRQGLRGTPAPGFSASSGAGRRPSRTLLCRLPAPATPRQSSRVLQGSRAAPPGSVAASASGQRGHSRRPHLGHSSGCPVISNTPSCGRASRCPCCCTWSHPLPRARGGQARDRRCAFHFTASRVGFALRTFVPFGQDGPAVAR